MVSVVTSSVVDPCQGLTKRQKKMVFVAALLSTHYKGLGNKEWLPRSQNDVS